MAMAAPAEAAAASAGSSETPLLLTVLLGCGCHEAVAQTHQNRAAAAKQCPNGVQGMPPWFPPSPLHFWLYFSPL